MKAVNLNENLESVFYKVVFQFMNLSETIFHAPVSEAIFEIQVELPYEITIENLERVCSKINHEYPTKNSRKRFMGKIEFKESQPPASESIDLGVDGFLNWSMDKKQVVQFRFDGYSFSRLKPYKSWEDHFPEVIKHWILFSKEVSPTRIKRITVRFINVIEIARESNLQDYFVNYPKIPYNISILNNFFIRTEFSISEKNINVVVTQALANSNEPKNKSICSEQGWDGYDANPINRSFIYAASRFLDLLPDNIIVPEVVPEPTGEIGFLWTRGKHLTFVVSVSPSTITFAGLLGASKNHGETKFLNELPYAIEKILVDYFSLS